MVRQLLADALFLIYIGALAALVVAILRVRNKL
jgi:hypothetical protein